MMAATGILPELLPGALQLPRLERLAQIDVQDRLTPDAILRLAALLPDDGRIITRVADRLRLSNAQRARLLAMPGGDQAIGERLSAAQARRILYRIGPQAFRDRVLLQWAGAPRGVSAMPWRLLLTMADNWQAPRFPLTGRDVMAAGVPEGPEVGKVLAALEQWWVDGDFAADEGALRDRLAAMARK
jgi:poly(A) polymerase